MYHAENDSPLKEKEFSIYDYYSVKNEVDFLTRQISEDVDNRSLSGYVKNNVFRFLEEFVVKEKTTKINYFLKNSRIYYDGVASPVSDNYKERAEASGENSREAAEYFGFKSIEETFANNEDEANVAFWVSPPSFGVEGFGDYGFLFIFLKDKEDKISEYILRYGNENKKLTKSFQVHSDCFLDHGGQSKNHEITEFNDEKDFLRDPLFAKLKNPLDLISKGKEISIIESNSLLNNWVEEYSQAVINLAKNGGSIKSAQEMLRAIYNLAEDLLIKKTNIETANELKENKVQEFSPEDQGRAYAYYSTKPAVVIGGGSCPASEQKKSHPFSGSPIDNLIKNKNGIIDHKTASEITSNKNKEGILECNCPYCHKHVKAKIKNETITCPKCKKSVPYKC